MLTLNSEGLNASEVRSAKTERLIIHLIRTTVSKSMFVVLTTSICSRLVKRTMVVRTAPRLSENT